MSPNYGESSIEILKQLAKSKELSQKEIPDLANCNYRTVLRELKILEDMEWIEFVRKKKNNGKRGAPLNMWKISFKGLITIMGFMDVFSDDFKKIVESHKDDWIIFEEWNFISKNDDVKLWVLNELKLFCNLHHVTFLIYYNIYKQRVTNEYNSEKLYEGEIMNSINSDLSNIILGIDNLLSFYGSSLRRNYNPKVHEYFIYFLKNPNLKTFIVNQLNYEERRLHSIQRIKKIYNL